MNFDCHFIICTNHHDFLDLLSMEGYFFFILMKQL